MTQREKNIGIGVVSAAVLGVLYYVVVSPYFDDVVATDKGLADARNTLASNNKILDTMQAKKKVWADIQNNGLKAHAEVTAAQSENALLRWVQISGVTAVERRRAAPTDLDVFQIINFSQTLTTPMKNLAQFVNQIETTNLPMRLTQLDLTPVKDGLDNVTATLTISALCKPVAAPAATPAAPAPQPEGP